MTLETERLRTDIERTREDVGEDVEALAEKVDPRRVAGRRLEAVRETATSVKDRVMGAAETAEGGVASAVSDVARMPAERTRGNPMAVGVIAFGIGWLLGSVLPMAERERTMARKAMEAAEPVTQEVKHAASEMADSMREPLQQAAERLGETATSSAESVKESAAQSMPAMASGTAADRDDTTL